MNGFLSLHVLADGCNESDINRAGRFLAACECEYYNLTTAARYNEAEKLIGIFKTLAPKARPIWRGWPTDALEDGGIWQRVKPQEWVNYRIVPNSRWLQAFNVVVLPCNEVGVTGAEAIRYAQWEADVIRLTHIQFGVQLAALRLSTGNPLETEHANYNAVLQAASEYNAILSPNEYTSTRMEITNRWHVGRYRWMWEQQDRLKLKRSPIVIGEYGIARVTGNNTLDPYNGYAADGVPTEQHVSVIKRDGLVYQPDGITACWFVFGRWPQGKGSFDVHTNEPLLSSIETESKAGNLTTKKRITQTLNPVIAVPPVVIGTRYTVTTPGAMVNMYADSSLSSGSMGTVPNQAVVMVVDDATVNGQVWRKIKYLAVSGWVLMDTGVSMSEYIPVIALPSEPQVNGNQSPKPTTPNMPETPQNPVNVPNSGNRNSEIVKQLKIIRGALDALIQLYEPIPA